MIIPHKNLHTNVIDVPDSDVEEISVSLTCGREKFILGSVYIPPNSSTPDQVQLSYHGYKFITCGDFNLPNAEWYCVDGNFSENCPPNSNAEIIHECFSYLDMYQSNFLTNNHGVYLDLCFSHLRNLNFSQAVDLLLPVSTHHIA